MSPTGAPPSELSVPLGGPLVQARFVARPNRFLVLARLPDGRVVEAHLPDPGRLKELLLSEAPLWLRPVEPATQRRTRWTALLVEVPGGGGLVSLDTGLPNRLVTAALVNDALDELRGWRIRRSEAPIGRSRIDFLLDDGGTGRLALEVKSVTLVEDGGVARFPDAVTERGARHVDELRRFVDDGEGLAAILFLLQRNDAERIEAARSIDPRFAAALRRAMDAGVQVLGRRCRVEPDRVVLGPPVPAGPD
jgi:sugar fermentation stimulation protein A